MLHTVNKSPFEKNSLHTCLRLSAAGSCILLIEDGVYAGIEGTTATATVTAAMPDKYFYALDADLKARGIKPAALIAGVKVINYDKFVELAARCDKVQSWF